MTLGAVQETEENHQGGGRIPRRVDQCVEEALMEGRTWPENPGSENADGPRPRVAVVGTRLSQGLHV